MESARTIKQMFAGKRISVPAYQRAYSWDTEFENKNEPKQVNTFLSDLENFYNRLVSSGSTRYYFGHFLFEEQSESKFGVIDGQQRMTTIVIFLSALFSRLEQIRPLKENERKTFEDIIKNKSGNIFATVNYDNQFFKDYVIDQSRKDDEKQETQSAERIKSAFNFFKKQLEDKGEVYLLKMLKIVQDASCTTHCVTDESEAIQMFIFQNNRGKKPSNLEIIKAQFMFNIHLHAGEEKEEMLEVIRNRFKKIYKSISTIENKVNEDSVLNYALRVHCEDLSKGNAIEEINGILSKKDPVQFIKEFTKLLGFSFEYLTIFFGKDEKENIDIHSLIALGGTGIAMPFIIKAYHSNLPIEQKNKLCKSFVSIILRHRLIKTRANITSRLNGVYKDFTTKEPTNIELVVNQIENIKNASSDSWWLAYWNNEQLERSLQGAISHPTAKYLLWKYENYLETQGKKGYALTRFDTIKKPELEHIAPQTENPEAGYDTYDEEFRKQYLHCLGNYLLLSKSHNCSIGNKPFADKLKDYDKLEQQRELVKMTQGKPIWTKELIKKRKEKIIKYIMETF